MILQTLKIWDLDSIEEPVHSIERHDLGIETVLVSRGDHSRALTKCRNCVLVWDTDTGKV